MKVGRSSTAAPLFFPVTGVDMATAKYIRTGIVQKKRYFLAETWHVHRSELLNVLKIAKQNNQPLDYSALPQSLYDELDQAIRAWQPKQYTLTKMDTTSAYAILHLLPSAPLSIVEAVWKSVIRLYHPDVGGDPEEFLRMKAAYEEIKDKAK